MIQIPDLEELQAPVLAALNGTLTPAAAYAVRDEAADHGLLPWLAHAALSIRDSDRTPEREWLAARQREGVAAEAATRVEARRAIELLAVSGVPCIVLKGAHLAHALYDAPHLRPHHDLDLLVSPAHRYAARAALLRAGYELVPHVRGDLILAQMHFVQERPSGVRHAIDLHWHALNPHAFRRTLPVEEALARARPIEPLGRHARGLCDPDALLLACAHLAAHHGAACRLIWLLDVDRIARRMTRKDSRELIKRARQAGLTSVTGSVLRAAAAVFNTPASGLERVGGRARSGNGRLEQLTAAHLRADSRAELLWLDLRSLTSWRDRADYLRQHLFPDAQYMAHRYGRGVLMYWGYFRRAAGALRWLRRRARAGRSADRTAAAVPPAGRPETSPSGAATDLAASR